MVELEEFKKNKYEINYVESTHGLLHEIKLRGTRV